MNNRNIIIVTFLLILIVIAGGTFYKVQKEHNKRANEVTEKRIVEGAIQCVWDDKCSSSEITLGFLIENGYAKEEVNPNTKLYYDHTSYVRKEKNQYIFIGL